MNLIDSDDLRLPPDMPYKGAVKRMITQQPVAFDMDMVLNQIEDYGKYKGVIFYRSGKEHSGENYIPVTIAKQIVRGRGLGGVLGYLEEAVVNENKIIHELEKLQVDHPDQELIVETPEGTVSLQIGDAVIYEGMNGEIVFDSE